MHPIENARPRIFLLLDPAEAYDRGLLRGIADFSTRSGHWRIFRPPPFWEGVKESTLYQYIERSRPDGLILIEREDMQPLRDLGVPMVVSPYRKRRISGVVNIVTAHEMVGEMAAEHLVDCGFRHFAFCGYRDMFWSDDRYRGFERALSRFGHCPSRLDPPRARGRGYQHGDKEILKWLGGLPRPVGVFAAIDARAVQMAELCSTAGVGVPDQVGLVGVNNDDLLCTTAPFPLSSVALTARQAGYEAARALDMQLRASRNGRKRNAGIVVRPTHVEGRMSTDFLNIDDAVLVRALRFIRSNASQPVRVEEVARSAGVSRRALEERFRSLLGRPVAAEIRRVRVEAFARLLRESNLAVGEIADKLGFPGSEHVSRFFKAKTGMSPLEYRRSHASANWSSTAGGMAN